MANVVLGEETTDIVQQSKNANTNYEVKLLVIV